MKNFNITAKDIAFLGHGSKMASIKHFFNNNILICQENQRFLLPPTLLSLFFGLYIPLSIYFTWIDLTKVPLFAKFLLSLAVLGSWILFIAMLLYHKHITFDFESNSLIFVKKVLKKKQYLIDLSQIKKILSSSIERVNSDRTDNVTTCHYFSIILIDNTEIRICETTNKDELESIINIILNHCENQPQWQKDSTIHLDNKLNKLRK